MKVTIFADGACEPVNPGGVAVACFVVINPTTGEMLARHAEVVAVGQSATSNVAEMAAIAKALNWAGQQPDLVSVTVRSDSQFAVNMVNGVWRPDPSKRYYRALVDAQLALRKLQAKGISVVVEWVPREQNQLADQLAKWLAMDTYKTLQAQQFNSVGREKVGKR